MRIIIGCERSGILRKLFRDAGHDAFSCDLSPSEDNSPFHIVGDVLDFINDGWDMGIFHPDCTYLTCSGEWAYSDGPYHQKIKTGTLVGAERREARELSLEFVRKLFKAKIKKKAIENPRGVISTRIRPADQYIQPFDFGDNASKITGLWLENLPKLFKTKRERGRFVTIENENKRIKTVERFHNQTDSGQNGLPPSEDRWMERSRTYPGVAEAIVDQWGKPLSKKPFWIK